MVNSRGDSRLDGLEKATAELNAQFQQTNERLSALGSKLDSIIEEMRAGFAALNHKSRAMPEDGASSENRESNSVSAGNKSTAPSLPSSPPTTIKENTLPAIQQSLRIQQTGTPLAVQQPISPPVLVPLPHPPSLPTTATPLTPATPLTLVPMTAPLLSTGTDIPQFQPFFFPLLRQTVPAAAARQAALMYLFLVHEHIPWFSFEPPVQKHEWEPPPNKVIGLNFELNLEGKVVLRVRQLIRIGGWGERKVVWPTERKKAAAVTPAERKKEAAGEVGENPNGWRRIRDGEESGRRLFGQT